MKSLALSAFIVVSINLSFATSNDPILVQLLGINDFHGALEPPSGSVGKINGIHAGGVEFLATHIKSRREGQRYTITLSAGDLFGGSPLLSAMFKEQPSVEAMNLLGLDLNAVGNHEFDKGFRELLRMQHGDLDEESSFAGANFQFLSANVIVNETRKTLFPAYAIREFGSAKVAFVGLVVQGTDQLVVKESIEGLTFLDEADAVNALIPELRAQGVKTIVVLIHEGGTASGGYNECPGISGPIVDIAQRMNDEVGVILSGHTHQAYNCRIGNKLVTSAASNGRLVTEVFIELSPNDGKLLSARAENIIVTRDVKKDEDQSMLIAKYKEIAAPIANRIIGHLSESLSRVANDVGESVLGRTIADAHLEAMSGIGDEGALVAFINPGGIRTDLTYLTSKEGEGDGNITFGEAYAVHPFGNNLITMTLTGKHLLGILEQQFAGCGFDQSRILQVSHTLRYTYRKEAAPCHKVDPETVTIGNEKLELAKNYRVAVNSFIANGGDSFSLFTEGTDRVTGMTDLDALTKYLSNHAVISPVREARISLSE